MKPVSRPQRIWPMLLLSVLLLLVLLLMSNATTNSQFFGQLYSWLLIVGGLGLLWLVAVIAVNLLHLVRAWRTRTAGARLTLRLVALFVVLAIAPVTLVYVFSLQFLQRGIDSWFDVAVEDGLNDALELSRAALDLRMREGMQITLRMANALADISDALAPLALDEFRADNNATELALISYSGRILAAAGTDPLMIVPDLPPEPVLMHVRQGYDYVSLDPVRDLGFQVRVVVNVPVRGPFDEAKVLQALFPVPDRFARLAESTQSAFDRYRQLVFLRGPLKTSFIVTLSLVLAFSVLVALWSALFAARRLVAPIRDLADGTHAVAQGRYDQQLAASGNDELGFLVESFNQMTRQLARARDAAERSQTLVERQRAYLEAVLARLSSGVLTLNHDGALRTWNQAASQILGQDLGVWQGRRLLDTECASEGTLATLLDQIRPHLLRGDEDWRQEVTQFGSTGRQVLMCRGSTLAGPGGGHGGYVIVFDDITTLVQAERDAAWSEVARRLAHEIKNPLTPIQLAAERIRHKYLGRLESEGEGRVLDRGTHTIIQQVQAMKEMVDVFNQYARPPRLRLVPVDLNGFVTDVMYLYRDYPTGVEIELDLDSAQPVILGDRGRLRQLVHNLVSNALDAMRQNRGGQLYVATRVLHDNGTGNVELVFRDDGPGFPEAMAANLFEPYVTTKPKGTGLGLAIVKKIVEEHGGVIQLQSPPEGGACISIRIPLAPDSDPMVGSAEVLSVNEEAR